MIKNKLPVFIFILIFAIAFAVPSIFFISSLNKTLSAKEIVKNGTQTQATPYNHISNLTVNNVKYYYIQYTYTVDDTLYYGETSERYTESECYKIFNTGHLDIVYDDEFNSIEANFEVTQPIKMELIMMSIFAIFDLAFWITLIVFIIQAIRYGILNILGKKVEATFISIKPGIIVNNIPMYKICYCWRNDVGDTCEGTSDASYTINQARAFEISGKFDILYYKTLSRIVSKPNKLFFQQAEQEHLTDQDYTTCEYCNSIYKSILDRCSSCGAPKTKKKNTKKN